MSKTITIRKKRMHSGNEKSITFLTSGYGGKFFTIPKSQIIHFKFIVCDLSPENKTQVDWIELEVMDWIYNKIKDKLEMISAIEINIK
jgi:hypothetical protein